MSGIAIIGGGGNLAANQTTVTGCGAEISYDYTPRQTGGVPEPGALALLGLGLLGLGVVRCRTR